MARNESQTALALVPILIAMMTASCRPASPSIEFTKVPAAAEGTPYRLDAIEGRVTGHKPGQRIVIFAKSGVWWIQPLSEQPFTAIQSDSTWRNSTHPGTEYAALLDDASFVPPATVQELPHSGGPVRTVATVKGVGGAPWLGVYALVTGAFLLAGFLTPYAAALIGLASLDIAFTQTRWPPACASVRIRDVSRGNLA